MSERYTRLFTLPENLYASGSPVLIAAGALLKDNQTGKALAQLKIKNIGVKSIKAARVCVQPRDTIGHSLGDPVVYQYLDLTAMRDADFGSKIPVALPDPSTRSFSVTVVEVIFDDNTVWNANNEPWEPLSPLVTLEQAMKDQELANQYRIHLGANCHYEPSVQKDLWYCSCGMLNNKVEEICHCCGASLDSLISPDIAAMETARDARISANKVATENKKKRTKNQILLGVFVLCAVIIFTILLNAVIIPNIKYNEAIALMEAGDLPAAALAFGKLENTKDAAELSRTLWDQIVKRDTIAIGYHHVVGLMNDGTVVAVGENHSGQCDVGSWIDIVAISAGGGHTVGLKSDGTVVAVGSNQKGQCNVENWTNIVAVSASGDRTVGLKTDGTVIAAGDYSGTTFDEKEWTDIVSISTSYEHTVGMKADGSVVAIFFTEHSKFSTEHWTNTVAVSSNNFHTIGMNADGTVRIAGCVHNDSCNAANWNNIVAVSAGSCHSVGLKADGTVIATGLNIHGECDVNAWRDVVYVIAGSDCTIGVRSNGSIVFAGEHECESHMRSWTNIKIPR